MQFSHVDGSFWTALFLRWFPGSQQIFRKSLFCQPFNMWVKSCNSYQFLKKIIAFNASCSSSWYPIGAFLPPTTGVRSHLLFVGIFPRFFFFFLSRPFQTHLQVQNRWSNNHESLLAVSLINFALALGTLYSWIKMVIDNPNWACEFFLRRLWCLAIKTGVRKRLHINPYRPLTYLFASDISTFSGLHS